MAKQSKKTIRSDVHNVVDWLSHKLIRKNIKSSADAGKRRSSFRAWVWRKRRVCNSSYFEFWRTIWYTKEWWIPVSREIWRVVLWLFGAPFWLNLNLLTETTMSSLISARTARSSTSLTPGRTASVTVFFNFLSNLFRPEIVQILPENYLISF